jgi:hypothetical protein
MKNFEHQYYRHKSRRPFAEASIDQSEKIFTVSFSWGEINPTEKLRDSFLNYFFTSSNDIEATSPFRILSSLTHLTNKIRAAMLLANTAVYNSFNTKALAAGAEFLCLAVENRELVIGKIGGPSVILVRNNENILLSSSTDLYFKNTNPLPENLIGVDNECYPQIASFRFEKGDLLFLISSSHLPANVLKLNLSAAMSNLTQLISQENPAVPFWIGRLSL